MIVVVPADPPRDGLVLSRLVDATPLSAADAALLYEAAMADVFRAVEASGGDLLVNYRDAETLPGDHAGGDPEAELRTVAANALGGTDDVRFERQIGSTRAARVGNTVTHLLETEEETSVGVLEPTAALVGRTEIDGAAMALRRNDVAFGPAPDGGTYFAGFADPIDFADAYGIPDLATLARAADESDRSIGFRPMVPTVATESGLCATVAGVKARRTAGQRYPEITANAVDRAGLVVVETADGAGIALE